MSLVCENIYNLIPKPRIKLIKPPRYISTFKEDVRIESKSNLFDHKSIGLAQYPEPDPKNYLKKGERDERFKALKTKLMEERHNESEAHCLKRPTIPSLSDKPVQGIKTKKNFIRQNAAENIMSVPKKPHKYIVDSKYGDKYDLTESGLEKNYTEKQDYGLLPQYLKERKEQVKQAQEQYDRYLKAMKERSALKQLSEQERSEILNGLRKNWQKYYSMYQGLSVMVDTAPKKHRKEWLEHEMAILEKDIEMVERHNVIMISK